MIFETHAHYDDEQFDADRDELLSSLADGGVGLVVNPSVTAENAKKVLAMAEQYPFFYAAVGVHPENCANYDENELAALRELAQHPKCVAIGEIGLDYYWEENPPREFQQRVFREQMALARELNLPVIVHDREAHADSLTIVKEFPEVKGVFHCYSGSAEMAKELLKLGWMISFTGVVTYKNARKTVEAAEVVPLDRLMIETDAPYMSPVPKRGTRNDSRNLIYIAEKLAEIKGISTEEMIRITEENAKRFFGIK